MKFARRRLLLSNIESQQLFEIIKNTSREILHVLSGAAGWIVFAYFWYLILIVRGTSSRQLAELYYILAAGIIIQIIIIGWIKHNQRIYRIKGARRSSDSFDAKYEHDQLGRKVIADWQTIKRANYIKIITSKRTKRYQIYRSARIIEDDPGA